jgi:hypothetical protein
MLTETFHSLITAARNVFKNWPSTLLIAAVYASLLAVFYFFVSVKEATMFQVTLTFASAIIAPILFFILQTMVAGESSSLPAVSLLRKSLLSFWKVILISLPLIALAVLIVYLLGKAQARFDANAAEAAAAVSRRLATSASPRETSPPIDWKATLLSTIRYLTFGLILPLAAIHLWLATIRDGLGAAIRRILRLVSRAFAPQAVLTYAVGFLVFAVAPYFLLYKTTHTTHAWLELSLLVARMFVVFALTLVGWLITVRALAQFSTNASTEPANEAT